MTLREVFSSIANAIRSKTGKTDTIKPVDMATEIESIQTSGVFNKLPQLVDGTLTTVTAEDLAGATQVRSFAFQNCSSLTSINIPNSATSIGSNAFANCFALISINIPDGITSINSATFYFCESLTQITIPNSVTSIGSSAFQTCSALIELIIPENVTTIGSNALRIGSSTKKATITMKPTTPPTIDSSTFNASYLNKIIVPVGCGDAYKSATNWSNFADYIEEATA